MSGGTSLFENAYALCDRIEARNPDLGAWITFDRDFVLKQAIELDRKRSAGLPLGALAGRAVAIKDNICIQGVTTSCASRALRPSHHEKPSPQSGKPPAKESCVRRSWVARQFTFRH